LVLVSSVAKAELPTTLTDKVFVGSGTIDLLKDVLPGELQSYLESGTFYLGVDLNEAASGYESADSVGMAIDDVTLLITTSAGEFSFSEVYTNTTAMIVEEGSATAQEYYTLFGRNGSSSINGGTSDFSFSSFDDVIEVRNIALTGDIQSAQLVVNFLDTADTGGVNEDFFDYSNGFEDFAIVDMGTASALESQAAGIGDATPTEVSFALSVPTGTPEPGWFFMLLAPLFFLFRQLGR